MKNVEADDDNNPEIPKRIRMSIKETNFLKGINFRWNDIKIFEDNRNMIETFIRLIQVWRSFL